MDNVNAIKEQGPAENTAEAENNNEAAAGLGKFGSVDALLNAYRALEAEFTRRSQRLKELEEENKAHKMSASGAPSPEEYEGEKLVKAALSDEGVKQAVIEEYLKSVAAGKGVPLISGGLSPAAPRTAPKSVKEAGALAQRFLKD